MSGLFEEAMLRRRTQTCIVSHVRVKSEACGGITRLHAEAILMHHSDSTHHIPPRLRRDFQIIYGGFLDYMRARHHASGTIAHHQRCLVRAAMKLGRPITTLRRDEIRSFIRRHALGRARRTKAAYQAALHAGLRFLGRFHTIDLPPRSISWLDDYARFLERDRGLRPISRTQHLHVATRYLRWQFGTRAPSWSRVRAEDVWGYAQKRRRDGYSASSLNSELCRLRQLFRFVHLRGACGPLLAKAVPAFSERGRKTPRSDVISEAERIRFLASFGKQGGKDLRDYAMALCMLELGLRCVEITRLRLGSIDWNQKHLPCHPPKAAAEERCRCRALSSARCAPG
jgi:integrase